MMLTAFFVLGREYEDRRILEMHDLNCPYCDHKWDHEYYDSPPSQDERLVIECPKCDKKFVAYASWLLQYNEEEADCLNTGEHDWQNLELYPGYPPGYARKRCSICDDVVPRDSTPEEIAAYEKLEAWRKARVATMRAEAATLLTPEDTALNTITQDGELQR